MLESLAVDGLKTLSQSNRIAQPAITPIIDETIGMIIQENGRIRLPGSSQGLSQECDVQDYLPLVHLQARILEASRILDKHRNQLRLNNVQFDDPQAPLTALTPSNNTPHLFYKREDQTVTKAYKLRGAVIGMSRMMQTGLYRRFIAVSTGNHALGVLKAAEILRPDAVRIVIPFNTASNKLGKIEKALDHLNSVGVTAILEREGSAFEVARVWAMENVAPDEYYLDPYNDPWVVAGQGTIGAELLKQLTPVVQSGNYEELLIVSPIGGGGLLTGTATAITMLSAWEPAFAKLKIRFVGMRLSNLDSPLGDAIRVPEMARNNQLALHSLGVQINTMTNQDMQTGINYVMQDLGSEVEGASGGTLTPVLFAADCKPSERRLVVCIMSGANTLKCNHVLEPAPTSKTV